MKRKHLLYGIGGIVILLVSDYIYGFIPGQFYIVGVALGIIAAAAWVFDSKYDPSTILSNSQGIPASQGFERVQQYLKDSKGKQPINYKKQHHLHEDTLELDKNGEQHRLYAVIGDENPIHDERDYGDSIRVIWDLDSNDLVTYDGQVRQPENLPSPFYGKEQYLKLEGYQFKNKEGEDGSKSEANVFIHGEGNSGNTGSAS